MNNVESVDILRISTESPSNTPVFGLCNDLLKKTLGFPQVSTYLRILVDGGTSMFTKPSRLTAGCHQSLARAVFPTELAFGLQHPCTSEIFALPSWKLFSERSFTSLIVFL